MQEIALTGDTMKDERFAGKTNEEIFMLGKDAHRRCIKSAPSNKAELYGDGKIYVGHVSGNSKSYIGETNQTIKIRFRNRFYLWKTKETSELEWVNDVEAANNQFNIKTFSIQPDMILKKQNAANSPIRLIEAAILKFHSSNRMENRLYNSSKLNSKDTALNNVIPDQSEQFFLGYKMFCQLQ